MISSLNGVLIEKDKQVVLMGELNTSYMKEIVYWREESHKHKKQRNLFIGVGALLLGVLVLK